MTLLDNLFGSYGFKELVDLIIDKFGFGSLVVLFSAFFAAISYFSTLPSKGPFSPDSFRSFVVGFFQQAFYIFSSVLFLMPFYSDWGSFILVLLLYAFIVAPMFINMYIFRGDFTFEEYVKFKKGGFGSMKMKYVGIAASWVAIFSELLAFSWIDPTLPLLGWIVIFYSFVAVLLQLAVGHGILSNIRLCIHANIITTDGPVEGFIVAKGPDHYIVKTRERDALLSSGHVKSIYPSNPPEP
ncbi:MAG: hypothetical protein QHH24_01335 [Candidatus Bathyarchaeota archaeon]|nr:hypothetical protein [Candidatus Bathyarchaeota archaeon]